ncbi:MAG: dihydrofolate reductase family protein [Bacteroidota bacterium]
MGKIIFYVAASLDGMISDENGGVDWLTPYQEAGLDYGYTEFYKNIGYIVTGSKTFEQAKGFPGGWAFPHSETYIFSSRALDTMGRKDLILWKGGIKELAEQLKKKEKDTWLLGGANLAGQFINEGQCDEVILSVMPTVLGRGRPLFDGIKNPFDLKLKKQESFPNGVVQLVYEL